MKLEDLTREELIALIRRHIFDVHEREILRVRWDRLSKEAHDTREAAIKESEKWVGKRDMQSIKNWNAAQEWFDRGMAISDKADEVFEEMRKLDG